MHVGGRRGGEHRPVFNSLCALLESKNFSSVMTETGRLSWVAWTSTQEHAQAVSGFYMGGGGLDPSDTKFLWCVGIMNGMGQAGQQLAK